ncbi:MAG TPA: hypothetical protein VGS22_27620 [Thermoanaerobaculia bacterium]|jgi:hypothetical protein|nr:hypothetical protein [Thermoanaerobaculia bacterium]
MKKEIAKRVLGRRLARQLNVNELGKLGGSGTSWYSTSGGGDVLAGDCTDNQDTFIP